MGLRNFLTNRTPQEQVEYEASEAGMEVQADGDCFVVEQKGRTSWRYKKGEEEQALEDIRASEVIRRRPGR